jgi:hypothetical protein
VRYIDSGESVALFKLLLDSVLLMEHADRDRKSLAALLRINQLSTLVSVNTLTVDASESLNSERTSMLGLVVHESFISL